MVPPLDNKYYILSEQGVTNLVYHYNSCGIQSWYRQDDRIGIESIYFKCIKKAKEIGYDSFEEDCYRYTPSYVDICLHRGVVAEFDRRWKKEIEESIEMIDLLPASELLECILYSEE